MKFAILLCLVAAASARQHPVIARPGKANWGVCPSAIATCSGTGSKNDPVIVKHQPQARFCTHQDNECKCYCNNVDNSVMSKADQATFTPSAGSKWQLCPAALATCTLHSVHQGLNGQFKKLTEVHTPVQHYCIHDVDTQQCVCKCSHFA